MALRNSTIAEIVIQAKAIPAEKLKGAEKIAKEMNRPLTQVLIETNLVDEKKLSQLVAQFFDVEFIDLASKKIPEKILDYVPEELARSLEIMPFNVKGKSLYLAMRDPKDLGTIDLIRKETGLDIKPFYITQQALTNALNQYSKSIKKEFAEIIAKTAQKPAKGKLKDIAKEVPVVKALETILKYASAQNASDIHIELMPEKLMVRIRVDGILRDVISLPTNVQPALVARVKILANLKIDEHRVPQDGRFNFQVSNITIALRVSIIPSFRGENVVLRLLAESARPMTLEELGMTGRNKEIIEKMIKEPSGMVLSTGPTGCGKTTTLYSISNILNTNEVKICTIEDPVEYEIKRVSQMQINPRIGLTFASGLRALLRHDPDIMMVGEIRDEETAKIATHAALTGHLVLSTLHTNSAASAIPRLIDMGVEPYLVSSTVNVVIAQRLVRAVCKHCAKKVSPTKEVIDLIAKVDPELAKGNFKIWEAKGCPDCDNTGYKGRIGIYEVFQNSDEISKLILKRAPAQEIEQAAKKEGFTSMASDGLKKALKGQTTVEEILRVTKEGE